MTRYVAGFMFDWNTKSVGLVRKNKPAWQAGKLNGIGGKIEEDETPLESMIREFEEETGVFESNWHQFCTLTGDQFEVHFFSVYGELSQLKTMETEEIVVQSLDQIFTHNCIPNLTWLIPMALTCGYDRGIPFNIQESCTKE